METKDIFEFIKKQFSEVEILQETEFLLELELKNKTLIIASSYSGFPTLVLHIETTDNNLSSLFIETNELELEDFDVFSKYMEHILSVREQSSTKDLTFSINNNNFLHTIEKFISDNAQ